MTKEQHDQPTPSPDEIPDWKRSAEALQAIKDYQAVVITERISPAQIVAGFILSKTGVIAEDPTIYTRDSYFHSNPTQNRGLPLFNRAINNPSTLKALIDKSELNVKEKSRLRRLADFTSVYRQFPDDEWWRAGSKIKNSKMMRGQDLHKALLLAIIGRFEYPEGRYDRSLDILEKLFNSEYFELDNFFKLAEVRVPVIKSEPGDPDVIEYTNIQFDRTRAIYLSTMRSSVGVGGSPNSGKSTFAASLVTRMQQLVSECVEDGILGEDELQVGHCDLDVVSPTLDYIMEDKKPPVRKTKKKWDLKSLNKAVKKARDARFENNITIQDLPGGIPDHITSILARHGRYTILIDRNYGENLVSWRNFLQNPPKSSPNYWDESEVVPSHLIHLHSVKDDPSRASGLREFRSLSRGSNRNFARGRVADLDRKRKPDDAIVNLVAHCLLFDFLPSTISRNIDYGISLRLGVYELI